MALVTTGPAVLAPRAPSSLSNFEIVGNAPVPSVLPLPFLQGQISRVPFIFTLGWIDDMYFEPMFIYIG